MRIHSRFFVMAAAITAVAAAADAGDGLQSLPAHIAVDAHLHVSAQPAAEAIAALPAAGVRTVIDLRPDAETPDLDEKAVVERSGMVYRSLPIAGAAGLTRANVTAFDRMLTEAKEGKVLVHCASGNRVGALMALRARWVLGKNADEALAIGKAAGLTGLAPEVARLAADNAVSAASPVWPPK
jgi:uncharacterized protein (TIGR01244 family)